MIRDYGDRALLVEFESTAEVIAFMEALDLSRPVGVADIVPGARSLLVTVAEPNLQAPARRALADITVAARPDSLPREQADVVIDVIYDGADLADVARRLAMTPEEVIDAHSGTPWRVGFGGFTPGFAYLVGGDPRLRVPRHDEPRTRVPAGSVAVAGEFTGVYPRESPGGWRLIGRTTAILWDIDRPQPALLRPGMWVSFRDVG